MSSKALSARQLWVAMLVGGLSPAAALAGSADWRWLLAAVPLSVLLGWLLLRRVADRPLFQGVGGGVLAVLYCGWAVVLLAASLNHAAERICTTNAAPDDKGWILLLITLPLLWMGWGKAAAFFRAVEIFWLAAVVMLAAAILFAVPRIEWSWLLESPGDWRRSAFAAVLTLSGGLFVLPYIYKVEGGKGGGLGWLTALGLLAAALAAATAGVLSPALAGELPAPFFVASGLFGESVRGEGLISALWLLPDLTYAGLLSRVWGGRRSVLAVAAGSLLAVTGIATYFSPSFLAVGTLILLLCVLLAPRGKGK